MPVWQISTLRVKLFKSKGRRFPGKEAKFVVGEQNLWLIFPPNTFSRENRVRGYGQFCSFEFPISRLQ